MDDEFKDYVPMQGGPPKPTAYPSVGQQSSPEICEASMSSGECPRKQKVSFGPPSISAGNTRTMGAPLE